MPDEETYRRVRLYLIHQFTSIGAPHIWNGDEMGMWGGDDPDCRKPLWWPEYDFDPEYRNSILDEEKIYDEVSFNADHFAFYKSLTRMRTAHPVLSKGDFRFLVTEGKKLGYMRNNATEEIIVFFNLDTIPHQFEIPGKGSFTGIMGSADTVEGILELEPLTAFVGVRKVSE